MTSIADVDAALSDGDLHAAWAAASKLPRGRLGLDYALAMVALLSVDVAEPIGNYEHAVSRWLQRLRGERPDVDADELAQLLEDLPDLAAVTHLAVACEREGWPVTMAALERLLPPAPR